MNRYQFDTFVGALKSLVDEQKRTNELLEKLVGAQKPSVALGAGQIVYASPFGTTTKKPEPVAVTAEPKATKKAK